MCFTAVLRSSESSLHTMDIRTFSLSLKLDNVEEMMGSFGNLRVPLPREPRGGVNSNNIHSESEKTWSWLLLSYIVAANSGSSCVPPRHI